MFAIAEAIFAFLVFIELLTKNGKLERVRMSLQFCTKFALWLVLAWEIRLIFWT